MSDDLIRQMSTPEFFGLPASSAIRHVQTHISHVFLTGQFAYKVKKPVNLHFLDFTTLDKREHFCREELRLNRRFAPGLYLGVVPIFEHAGRFSLDSPTPTARPVEFALKMRQFADHDLLTHWIEDGRLTEPHVRDIARKMVRLHAAASTNAHIASFGMPDAVRKMIADNFAALERFIGGAISREQFDRIRESVMGAIQRDRALIEARARGGRIRECHGDLHLRNMCWFDGEIQFFDCIEFNEEYRCIDVMYELAFLAMDLDYRGRGDLANALTNEYLEQSGDYAGAVLLPAYLAVRAWIRSKVACLMLDDPEVSDDERAEARNSAAAHFGYAERRAQSRPPMLILVSGVSGTGKSTVARELAKRLDAIHIRSDAVRKHLAGVPLTEHTEAIYSEASTDATYTALADHARRLLRAGWTVILDATFLRAQHRVAARAAADEYSAAFRIVHLNAPESVLRARISARKADVSDAAPELVREQLIGFEEFIADEQAHVVEVDASGRIDYDVMQQACTGL